MDAMTMDAPGTEVLRAYGQPRTIMVVDDGDLNRMLISLILRKEGYKVLESSNGRDALEVLSDNHIDMLITDLNMPEMDGIELVKQIRSRAGLGFVPIVMISSEFLEARIQKAYEAGINDWLPKPHIANRLSDVLAKYVRKYCA